MLFDPEASMATMRGALMAACLTPTSIPAVKTKKTQFTVSRSQQEILSASYTPPCAAATFLRGGMKTELMSDTRLRSGSIGFCGLGPSSSATLGSHFGSRLYSREGSGFGSSCESRQISSIVAKASKNGIEAPERILAALGYILPLFDGIQYGRYFFLQYPVAENLLRPLYPLLAAYKGFPYSNFIAFFSLYLLVVRNQSVSRYVRFNAMQAVVLDVLLILPTLVERTFAPRGGFGFELLIIFYNTVFLFLASCFVFGVVSCILGKTPRLPIVADAADAQV